jgi:hypothetical protein
VVAIPTSTAPTASAAVPDHQPGWKPFLPGGGPILVDGTAQLWRAEVAWRETSVAPSCIYFVAPGSRGHLTSLGQEARILQQQDKVRISFGSDAEYTGQLAGKSLTLHRTHEYTFRGDLWVTTEEMVGTFSAGVFEGSYRYEECDKSGKQGCPTRCVLQADLSAVPTTAPR